MLKLCVVGKDVSASLSPRMHSFILIELEDEDCVYDTLSLTPEDFEEIIGELLAYYDGINVTIPYKGSVIPHLKALKGDAQVFGAVNTVLTRTREGYNTDGFGFMLMLANAGVKVKGKRVLVLGAGGAGRSCVKKLLDAGAEVFVYERDGERLQTVYREFGGFTPLAQVPICSYDVVINCTGVGMHDTVGKTPTVCFERGGERPVGEELLGRIETAVDLIYEPEQSEFLRIADKLGKKTVNGEAMLFYQAYAADCIYLNREPNAEEAKRLWNEYKE
ncbi:MAG: shikimate dehydrogenase [Clostridiales bacterium]|nr:shikimate dehydrogenase [Clostridiales bacterium]